MLGWVGGAHLARLRSCSFILMWAASVSFLSRSACCSAVSSVLRALGLYTRGRLGRARTYARFESCSAQKVHGNSTQLMDPRS
jgi:hypothetical protein